jgi:hypothetical protein
MQKILNSGNKGPIDQSTLRTIFNSNNEQEIQKAVNDFMNSKPYKPAEATTLNYMSNPNQHNQPNTIQTPTNTNNKNGKKSGVCAII